MDLHVAAHLPDGIAVGRTWWKQLMSYGVDGRSMEKDMLCMGGGGGERWLGGWQSLVGNVRAVTNVIAAVRSWRALSPRTPSLMPFLLPTLCLSVIDQFNAIIYAIFGNFEVSKSSIHGLTWHCIFVLSIGPFITHFQSPSNCQSTNLTPWKSARVHTNGSARILLPDDCSF